MTDSTYACFSRVWLCSSSCTFYSTYAKKQTKKHYMNLNRLIRVKLLWPVTEMRGEWERGRGSLTRQKRGELLLWTPVTKIFTIDHSTILMQENSSLFLTNAGILRFYIFDPVSCQVTGEPTSCSTDERKTHFLDSLLFIWAICHVMLEQQVGVLSLLDSELLSSLLLSLRVLCMCACVCMCALDTYTQTFLWIDLQWLIKYLNRWIQN